jgi:hypothetical protein
MVDAHPKPAPRQLLVKLRDNEIFQDAPCKIGIMEQPLRVKPHEVADQPRIHEGHFGRFDQPPAEIDGPGPAAGSGLHPP